VCNYNVFTSAIMRFRTQFQGMDLAPIFPENGESPHDFISGLDATTKYLPITELHTLAISFSAVGPSVLTGFS